jgi:hypothetical protein
MNKSSAAIPLLEKANVSYSTKDKPMHLMLTYYSHVFQCR